MKEIVSKLGRVSTEYFVMEVDQPIKINFVQQVEDILVSSPDIDILIGWDYGNDELFRKDNSLLMKSKDNLKEFSKERCTLFYLMPRNEGEKGIVYVTATR